MGGVWRTGRRACRSPGGRGAQRGRALRTEVVTGVPAGEPGVGGGWRWRRPPGRVLGEARLARRVDVIREQFNCRVPSDPRASPYAERGKERNGGFFPHLCYPFSRHILSIPWICLSPGFVYPLERRETYDPTAPTHHCPVCYPPLARAPARRGCAGPLWHREPNRRPLPQRPVHHR